MYGGSTKKRLNDFPHPPAGRPPKAPNKHSTPRTRNRFWESRRADIPASVVAAKEGVSVAHVYGVTKRFARQDRGLLRKG